MSDRSDSLLKRLSEIDPTRVDPRPAEGSRRYQSILEAAMRTHKDPDTTAPAVLPPAPLRWRRRLAFAAAAAVVVAAVAVAIVLTQPQHALTPEAAVAAAAVNLGDATTLRGTMVKQSSIYGEGGALVDSLVTGTVAVEGANVQVTIKEETEGQEPNSYSFTVIGNQMWTTQADGSTTSETLSPNPDERLAPFAAASKALLEAALADASVVNMGPELVRDRPATHYRLEPAESWRGPLAQLSPSVLAWFELEAVGAENVHVAVDVWVSDGAIVRMTVDETNRNPFDGANNDWEIDNAGDTHDTATFEYYDYGADIHIEPPAGS